MKTIKCDRCGAAIPYVPPYVNAAKNGKLLSGLMISWWNASECHLEEVDLCENCKVAVQNYIFNYREGEAK